MAQKAWFEVDRDGLAKVLARKGKAFVAWELLQNAWDSDAAEVHVTVSEAARREGGGRRSWVTVRVEDDDPEGFRDLSHAFTLFAESAKKTDPTKRGRFNLGEKLVLAAALEATISTTKGTVAFNEKGRRVLEKRRERGSVFEGVFAMTSEEREEVLHAVRLAIAPAGKRTTLNGEPLHERLPIRTIERVLPTEVAGDDGVLSRTSRKTTVSLHEPLPGEKAWLFEMGIPICELEDRWSYDVGQKVPLTMDREGVAPSFVHLVRIAALDAAHDLMTSEDANGWARAAATDERASDEAARAAFVSRFGEKALAFDPNDLEGNKRATAAGYNVVGGRSLTKGEWERARKLGILPPAGKVTPSPKPYDTEGSGDAQKVIPEEEWTPPVRGVAEHAILMGAALYLPRPVTVVVVSDIKWPPAATFGPACVLTLNLGRLGRRWFEDFFLADAMGTVEVEGLLIHEFAHATVADHLSEEFHDETCRLGAVLADAYRRGRLTLGEARMRPLKFERKE